MQLNSDEVCKCFNTHSWPYNAYSHAINRHFQVCCQCACRGSTINAHLQRVINTPTDEPLINTYRHAAHSHSQECTVCHQHTYRWATDKYVQASAHSHSQECTVCHRHTYRWATDKYVQASAHSHSQECTVCHQHTYRWATDKYVQACCPQSFTEVPSADTYRCAVNRHKGLVFAGDDFQWDSVGFLGLPCKLQLTLPASMAVTHVWTDRNKSWSPSPKSSLHLNAFAIITLFVALFLLVYPLHLSTVT